MEPSHAAALLSSVVNFLCSLLGLLHKGVSLSSAEVRLYHLTDFAVGVLLGQET